MVTHTNNTQAGTWSKTTNTVTRVQIADVDQTHKVHRAHRGGPMLTRSVRGRVVWLLHRAPLQLPRKTSKPASASVRARVLEAAASGTGNRLAGPEKHQDSPYVRKAGGLSAVSME